MWSRIRRSVVSVLHIPAIKRGNWQPLFMIFSFKTSLIWHFQPCLITRGYNSSAPKDCKVMGVWGGSHGRGWHHRAEWELCRIEYWVTGETATEIPILVRMTSPTTTLAYIRWKTIFFFNHGKLDPNFCCWDDDPKATGTYSPVRGPEVLTPQFASPGWQQPLYKPCRAKTVSTCRIAERSILHAGDFWYRPVGDQGVAFHGQ